MAAMFVLLSGISLSVYVLLDAKVESVDRRMDQSIAAIHDLERTIDNRMDGIELKLERALAIKKAELKQ